MRANLEAIVIAYREAAERQPRGYQEAIESLPR